MPYIPTRFTLLVALILLFAGCSTNPKGPRGYNIIPPGEMIDLLADLHYYDGLISQNDEITAGVDKDSTDLYRFIFEKHGVDRLKFEKSMNYYAFEPGNFERMYAEVIEKLNKRQTEISATAKTDPEQRETEDLWNRKSNWSFPEDGANKYLSVDVTAPGPGEYTFTAEIRMQPHDFSENPRITLWFWYDDGTEEGERIYFPEENIIKDGRLREYSITKELEDPDVTRIKGKVLNHSNPDSTWEKHADVYNIKLEYREFTDR